MLLTSNTHTPTHTTHTHARTNTSTHCAQMRAQPTRSAVIVDPFGVRAWDKKKKATVHIHLGMFSFVGVVLMCLRCCLLLIRVVVSDCTHSFRCV